jgi:hypothetical protein
VSLRSPTPIDIWQETPERLRVRAWSDIKAELGKAARENALLFAERATIEVEILSTGDALITSELRDVRMSRLSADKQIFELPLSISCPAQVRPPLISVLSSKANAYAGKPTAVTLSSRPEYWKGIVCVPLSGDPDVSLTITYRFVAFAAFAQNDWQFWLLNGDPLRDYERYGWFARLPVQSRATIIVRAPTPVTNFVPFYENIDGGNDAREVEQMVVETTHERDQVMVVASLPIWGSLYGLQWWGRVGRTIPYAENEALRMYLAGAARDGANSATAVRTSTSALLEEFAECEDGIELVLFAIDTAEPPAKLRPVGWTVSANQSAGGTTLFTVGAGVAGRAAWLADSVSWVQPVATRPEATNREQSEWDDIDDVYLTVGTSRPHLSVLAIPLPLNSTRPVAVLSIANRKAGNVHAYIEGANSLDAGLRGNYTKKITTLAERLYAACAQARKTGSER